jgi:GntR family transcriptional regulator
MKVGAQVTADEFTHSVPSIDEIMSWASESRFCVDRCAIVRADARLAQRLNCSPGGGGCWAEAYLHHAYVGIREQIGCQPGPVYGLIEEVFGERIVEVRETVRATTISPALAVPLRVDAGSPALVIDRVYRAANDRVVEIAHSIHPADRFSYAITLRRANLKLDSALAGGGSG